MPSPTITIEAIYQIHTPRAVCVREVEDGVDVWLPLSEASFEGDAHRGAVITLTAPRWLLHQKGFHLVNAADAPTQETLL